MNVDDLIAFSAPKLQASLTGSFFVDYAQRILVEGYTLKSHFKSLLSASAQSNVARHTNIVYFHRQNRTTLSAFEFTFTHTRFRPWGWRIPPACSSCRSPRPWSKPIKQGTTLIFVCNQEGCRGTLRFSRPDDVDMVGENVNGGRWMVKERLI